VTRLQPRGRAIHAPFAVQMRLFIFVHLMHSINPLFLDVVQCCDFAGSARICTAQVLILAVHTCRLVSFRDQPRLAIPGSGNVTIDCGGSHLDTYSREGPMHMGTGAVIGMQNCHINTFRDADDAISAGRRADALVSVFGNPVNGVAQVRQSTIFFPRGVRRPPGTPAAPESFIA
jgi:hypothetical protein